MKLEDFQEMVESSRAGKGKPGSRNSMPTPGGSVTHPPTAIKRELNWVIFSFPKKIQEKNINRTPGVTAFLSTFFHKSNQAVTTYLMSSYQAPYFTYIFI